MTSTLDDLRGVPPGWGCPSDPATAEHLALVAACGARLLRTLAWTGFSVEPALSGRFSF